MNNIHKLFKEGYKFVYRMEELKYNIDNSYKENEEYLWRRFSGKITSEVYIFFNKLRDENTLEIGFSIDLDANNQCFMAFCYPLSYMKNLVI